MDIELNDEQWMMFTMGQSGASAEAILSSSMTAIIMQRSKKWKNDK